MERRPAAKVKPLLIWVWPCVMVELDLDGVFESNDIDFGSVEQLQEGIEG